MSELKRCPFCGGEAKQRNEVLRIGGYSRGVHRQYIHCVKCCCRTMSFDWDDEKAMVKAWNRRIPMATLDAEETDITFREEIRHARVCDQQK